MIRESIANTFIALGRTIGRTLGCELAVEVSDHSIKARMEKPDKDKRAWDPNLYRHGNLFVSNYSNPIKPQVNQHPDLDTPDRVTAETGNPPPTESEDGEEGEDDGPHVELITSGRYREYMRQDLISQLLTPESRWNLLVWGVLGIATLQFLTIIVTLWATGSFA